MINVFQYPAQFKKPYQITGNNYFALKRKPHGFCKSGLAEKGNFATHNSLFNI